MRTDLAKLCLAIAPKFSEEHAKQNTAVISVVMATESLCAHGRTKAKSGYGIYNEYPLLFTARSITFSFYVLPSK
jgi:hypothetical protein